MSRLPGITVIFCALLLVDPAVSAQGRDYATEAFQLRMDGRWNRAQEVLEQAIAVDSADARAYFELGRIKQLRLTEGLDRFGQLHSVMIPRIKEERALLEECIRRDPSYARAYLWAGLNESQLLMTYIYTPSKWGNLRRISKRSLWYFERAVVLDPEMMEARAHLVSLQRFGKFMGGDKKAAWAELRDLEDRSPVNAVYAGVDMIDEDELPHWLDSLLAAHPDDIDLLERVMIHRQWKIPRDQRPKVWQQVLDRDPARMAALNAMINTADTLSNDSLYVAYISRFADVYRDSPAFLRSMEPKMYARLYSRLGNAEKAGEYRAQARKLDEAMIQYNLQLPYDWLTPP